MNGHEKRKRCAESWRRLRNDHVQLHGPTDTDQSPGDDTCAVVTPLKGPTSLEQFDRLRDEARAKRAIIGNSNC